MHKALRETMAILETQVILGRRGLLVRPAQLEQRVLLVPQERRVRKGQ